MRVLYKLIFRTEFGDMCSVYNVYNIVYKYTQYTVFCA